MATRLAIQPGHTVRLINPPANFKTLLGRLPAGSEFVEKKNIAADRVLVFTSTKKELESLLPQAMEATSPDGALWVAYPKLSSKQSDLSRQVVHDEIRIASWKPVSQISIDDVWSAIRARPATSAERSRV